MKGLSTIRKIRITDTVKRCICYILIGAMAYGKQEVKAQEITDIQSRIPFQTEFMKLSIKERHNKVKGYLDAICSDLGIDWK